ncbi:pilin [Pseudonocardia sp. CA-107938]|uniref:pilin n=1 Tax=Pseudonocardia sp. CA-107938 TaxID=3240021 RepID=UPI003D92A6D9
MLVSILVSILAGDANTVSRTDTPPGNGTPVVVSTAHPALPACPADSAATARAASEPVGHGARTASDAGSTRPDRVAGDQIVLAQVGSVDQLLTNLRNWLMGILFGLTTVCVTVAGVRYVTSDGDPSQVERAKATLRSGAWGLALAALAPLVVEILKSVVGA